MRWLVATMGALAISGLLIAGGVGSAAGAAGCTFLGGFAAIRSIIPDRVGDCLEDQHEHPITGDILQTTAGGTLVQRRSDGWTGFNDGFRTWVERPTMLSKRLSLQRFIWEPNPDGLPVVEEQPWDCVGSVEARTLYSPVTYGIQTVYAEVKDSTDDPMRGVRGSVEVRHLSRRVTGMVIRSYDLPPTDSRGHAELTWRVDGARGWVRVIVTVQSGGCRTSDETGFWGRSDR